MNKLTNEDVLELFKLFEGFWEATKELKIGMSWVEFNCSEDGFISLYPEAGDIGDLEIDNIHELITEFRKHNILINFDKEKAVNGKFYTIDEIIDRKAQFTI